MILMISTIINGQNLSSAYTSEKIDKGLAYCDGLDFRKINNEKTFLFCKDIYGYKNDFRRALHIMLIADKKFPYSYNIRLHKALALKQNGSTSESERELTGLIMLYPDKFELHNYLGRIQYDENRILAVMPFIFSAILEPRNPVTAENLIFIKRLLHSKSLPFEVRNKTGADILKTGENNFDLVHYEITTKKDGQDLNNDIEYLKKRMKVFLSGMKSTRSQQSGFFWNFYGAYFLKVEDAGLSETLVDHMYNQAVGDKSIQLHQLNSKFGIN